MVERWVTIAGLAAVGSVLAIGLVNSFTNKFRRIIVNEFQVGLLYKKGVFIRELSAGAYWVWTPTDSINVVDVRRATLTLSGQEVVTADNVGIKFSCLLIYRVADAKKAINESQGWYQEIYAYVQLALRDVISTLKLDEILAARSTLGDQLVELVKPKAAEIGIEMSMVQIKDIILPSEIKKIYSELIRAQKEGAVALERARGEQAALRNLANAARLIEDNPALMNLRILQSLASQSGQNAPTIILGAPGLLPVGAGKSPSGKQTKTQSDEEPSAS